MIRGWIAFTLLLSTFIAYSQHPELSIRKSTQSSSIEQAHYYYERGNYAQANTAFFEAIDQNQFKTYDFVLFANSLMAEKKTALAKEIFKEYLDKSNNTFGEINDMAQSIFRKDTNLIPESSRILGSDGIYNPSLFGGKIYASKAGRIVSGTYACTGELSEYQHVFSNSMNTAMSSVAFLNDGFSAVITLISAMEGSCNLYLVHRSREGWSTPKKVIFDNAANYCSPYFDTENNILYFASDRAGGQGGYDLYMSYFVKGKFQNPINLGHAINSPGDELSAIRIGKWIYFSSNGHPSKGGFDIYKYRKIDDFTHLILNDRKFNSSEDEFSILMLSENKYVVNRYVDSNSYLVQFSTPRPLNNYQGVIHASSGLVLSNAVVLIHDDQEGKYLKTNTKGEFSFQLAKQRKDVVVAVHLEGYRSNQYQLVPNEMNELILYPTETLDIVKVVNDNPSESEVKFVPSTADSLASSEPIFNPQIDGVSKPVIGTYYVIVASARNYNNAYTSWSKWVEEFNQLEIIQFSENLYRIGYKAGELETDAISALRQTIKVKSDAWIIRPGTH